MARWKQIVWSSWLALIAAAATPGFLWEVEYFRSPGPRFHTVLIWSLPLCCALCSAYLHLRRNWLRFELPALAVIVLAVVLVTQPLAALIALLLFLSCFAAGVFAARQCGIPLHSAPECLSIGFSLGCAMLILTLLLLGIAHLLFAALLLVVLAAPLVGFRRIMLEELHNVRRSIVSALRSPDLANPLWGAAFLFLTVAAFCTLAVEMTPSIAFDPLAAHLASARQYAAWHALQPLRSVEYSYYPQGGELMMAAGYLLGGQMAAQTISPLCWLMFLVVLFAIARTCGFDRAAAATGVAAAALLPFAHWTGSNAKNDAPMFLFQAAALYAFLRWQATRSQVWIPVGALFLGCTFTIKHTALFGAIPLACMLAYAIFRSARRLRLVLVCALLFAAFALYWPLHTWWVTGNPVYPSSMREGVSVQIKKRGQPGLKRLRRYAQIAWAIQFHGQDVFESPLPNPIGFTLLLFLPATLLVAGKRHPARKACLIFAAAYLSYWFLAASILRYAAFPFCLLMLLIAGKAKTFYDELGPGMARLSMVASLVAALLFALLGTAIIEINGPMLALLAHRVEAPAYLKSALRTYGALEWLSGNKVTAPVLGVDNFSRAYAPDPASYYTILSSDRRLTARIAQAACEYIIVPHRDTAAHETAALPDAYGRTPVYRDRWFSVYRLAHTR